MLVIFIGGLGVALLGRITEAVWFPMRDRDAGWLPSIRIVLLGEALFLLVVGIVVGLVELHTFTK